MKRWIAKKLMTAQVECWLVGHERSTAGIHKNCSCPHRGEFYCHRCRRWWPL
jgi:hypothetical protein